MSGSGDAASVESVADFLSGDRIHCPMSTWVHYAQILFAVAVLGTAMFCGTRAGG